MESPFHTSVSGGSFQRAMRNGSKAGRTLGDLGCFIDVFQDDSMPLCEPQLLKDGCNSTEARVQG